MQTKLITSLETQGETTAYWVTRSDWSGFIIHDIVLDLVSGEISAWNRFSRNAVDASQYTKDYVK